MIGKIHLKRLLSPRITNGHPWIYENEIDTIEGSPAIGDIVDVFTSSRQWLGRGYFNSNSKIVVRLLTKKNETIDRLFLESRIRDAIAFRKRMRIEESAYRLVYGEADGLCGLIIDKLGDVLVFQFNTAGMQRFREEVFAICEALFPKAYFYEKSDVLALQKEGVPYRNGWVNTNRSDAFALNYKDLYFLIRLDEAQKTGIYLDQLENAIIASALCSSKGKNVWDIFSNTGNFGLRMLQKGAKNVIFVDQSKPALDDCLNNVNNNGFEGATIIEGNAFDLLRSWEETSKKADIIILDPPSFTKSRSSKGNALRGYKEINLRALKCLPENGFLVTASCSQAISRQEFEMMIYSSASDVGAKLRLIYRGGQPIDHPILMNVFETDYLKFYIFERIA
jgi:23S rRNA (cytosine1962-C5)-methyltransferase